MLRNVPTIQTHATRQPQNPQKNLLPVRHLLLRFPSLLFGVLAQLVERLNGIEEVRGSNPLGSTLFWRLRMSMTFHLRRAAVGDMLEVARLYRRAFFGAMPHMPVLHTPEEDVVHFTEHIFPECEVWLGEADSALAGFIALQPGLVRHLYVDPKLQRRGFGRALLSHAQAAQPKLQLWAFQCNTPARRFYEQHGFIPIRETDGAANQERQPDVLYEWSR